MSCIQNEGFFLNFTMLSVILQDFRLIMAIACDIENYYLFDFQRREVKNIVSCEQF
jgi:hypothetical protein